LRDHGRWWRSDQGTGTDRFARRFNDAGFAVLAFDYRRLGESGGQPRQLVRMGEQLTDWRAAIAFAATLPGVDPTRLAGWGFSLSGGHLFRVAASNPQLAAAIAQTPLADGPAASRQAARHQKPLAMLRLTGRGILDAVGGFLGRRPRLVPLAGEPGTVSMLTTPDSLDGDRALNRTTCTRTGNRRSPPAPRYASRSTGPAGSPRECGVPARPRLRPGSVGARRARRPGGEPRSSRELVRMPGGHYAPFLDGHEPAVDAELSFLHRHLLDPAGSTPRTPTRPAEAATHADYRAVRRDIDYEDTGGTGPTIVLLHGLMMGRITVGAADRRAIRRSPVRGPDPAARRASSRDARCRPVAARIARLIAEFLDRLDLHDVVLVGNDTGGALGQLIMADGASGWDGSCSSPATHSTTSRPG